MTQKRWSKKGESAGDHMTLIYLAMLILAVFVGFILNYGLNQITLDEEGYYAKDGAFMVDILGGSPGPVRVAYPLNLDKYTAETNETHFMVYQTKYSKINKESFLSKYPFAYSKNLEIQTNKLGKENYYIRGDKIIFSSVDEFNPNAYACPDINTIQSKKANVLTYCKYNKDIYIDSYSCNLLDSIFSPYTSDFGFKEKVRLKGAAKVNDDEVKKIFISLNPDIFVSMEFVKDEQDFAVVYYNENLKNAKLGCYIANALSKHIEVVTLAKDNVIVENSNALFINIEFHLSDIPNFIDDRNKEREIKESLSSALKLYYGIKK